VNGAVNGAVAVGATNGGGAVDVGDVAVGAVGAGKGWEEVDAPSFCGGSTLLGVKVGARCCCCGVGDGRVGVALGKGPAVGKLSSPPERVSAALTEMLRRKLRLPRASA